MKHPTANLPEGSKGIKIKTKQPELWTKCLQGEKSIDRAYKEVQQEHEQTLRKIYLKVSKETKFPLRKILRNKIKEKQTKI